MSSLDERREVAARLRRVSGAPEWATTACCIAECLGEHDYPLWNDSKPLFNRLADLIEPEPERTLSEKDALAVVYEHICGDGYDAECRAKSIIHELAKMCGAKVVGE